MFHITRHKFSIWLRLTTLTVSSLGRQPHRVPTRLWETTTKYCMVIKLDVWWQFLHGRPRMPMRDVLAVAIPSCRNRLGKYWENEELRFDYGSTFFGTSGYRNCFIHVIWDRRCTFRLNCTLCSLHRINQSEF